MKQKIPLGQEKIPAGHPKDPIGATPKGTVRRKLSGENIIRPGQGFTC